VLHVAMDGALSLDEINPWHFRAPLAPLLAARREQKHLHLSDVVAHVRAMQKRFNVLLVEGAGGLLSPLGENFDSGDLITALDATPIVVAPNRLGVVNHILLTLEALPRGAAATARVVLVSPRQPNAAARMNAGLLAEFFSAEKIFMLPWLGNKFSAPAVLRNARVRRTLGALA